jgi:hypothetical protein
MVAAPTSANSGVAPAQTTACALAAKVKLGITTRPVTPRAWYVSISPLVQLETATA